MPTVNETSSPTCTAVLEGPSAIPVSSAEAHTNLDAQAEPNAPSGVGGEEVPGASDSKTGDSMPHPPDADNSNQQEPPTDGLLCKNSFLVLEDLQALEAADELAENIIQEQMLIQASTGKSAWPVARRRSKRFKLDH